MGQLFHKLNTCTHIYCNGNSSLIVNVKIGSTFTTNPRQYENKYKSNKSRHRSRNSKQTSDKGRQKSHSKQRVSKLDSTSIAGLSVGGPAEPSQGLRERCHRQQGHHG